MGDFLFYLQVAFAALIAAEAAVLLLRLPKAGQPSESLRGALFLALLCLRLLAPDAEPASSLLGAAVVWSAGDVLIGASPAEPGARGLPALLLIRRPAWGLLNAAFSGILLVAVALGYLGTTPLTAFRDSFQALLSVFPIVLLGRLYGRSGRPALLGLLCTSALWLAAAAVDRAVSAAAGPELGLAGWAVCLLGACTAYLVFVDDARGLSSLRAQGGERDLLMASLYARMRETQTALVSQDRLIASGLLALGAAHDFKNTLAHLKAAAEYGMAQPGIERKQESLRLVAELAETGGRSAVEFLERVSREGREEPRETDLGELAGRLLRALRPACRPEGVLLRGELTPRLCTLVRPGEVEQILFNLIRNALEGFRRGSREGEKTVSLVLHGTEEAVVVDVIDNAGGVPEQAAGKLFQINPASTGTGLGLYISRSLAERSGGTLVYEPRPGGSCFRLTLPVAKPEAGEKGHPGQE